MTLQLREKNFSISEKHKSEGGTSDLLGGLDGTDGYCDASIISSPIKLDNRGLVSSDRFIKFIPSEKSDWLLKTYPFAFLLLTLIAQRARRTSFSPDGRDIGEAYIGDWKSIGATRQQYRTSLRVLCDMLTIKIIETNRNRKKSTNGTTTAGTKVRLLSSDIYDININPPNHRPNHCPTTAQPLPNHEQECKERKRKEKKTNPQPPSQGALELFDFFVASLRKNISQLPENEYPKSETVNIFDALLKTHDSEKIKKVIVFAHSGFWAAHVHTPVYLKNKFTKISMSMDRESNPKLLKQEVDRRQKNQDGSLANPQHEELF